MALDPALTAQLDVMSSRLAQRMETEHRLNRYYEGNAPFPDVIVRAKVTRAYQMLMGMAQAPWGSLVVDAVTDRLTPTGITTDDPVMDEALWDIWEDNHLDDECKLVHKSALISGRAYALVWVNSDTGEVEITFDNSGQMICKYPEGRRRGPVSAFRLWQDEETGLLNANLFTANAIYKVQGPKNVIGPQGIKWEPRIVPDEEWPLVNPFGQVPVAELAVNQLLKPGCWGHARGEFEHVTSLIDRLSLTQFILGVCQYWLAWPIRAIIGDTIMRDDDGNPIAPFEIGSHEILQIENPAAKLAQWDSADLSGLSIMPDLSQLAALTKTPATALPLLGTVSNISADALRAMETSLCAKVDNHKGTLSEGWESVLRLAGLMSETPIIVPSDAELQWTDHRNISLSERADAASKLASVMPIDQIMSSVLNLSPEEQAELMEHPQMGPVVAALQPVPQPSPPAPVPAPQT